MGYIVVTWRRCLPLPVLIREKEKFLSSSFFERHAKLRMLVLAMEVTILVTIVDGYVRDRVTIQDGKRSPLDMYIRVSVSKSQVKRYRILLSIW